MSTEADTCRTLVLPKLYAAGWTDDQLAEQRTYTAGRIIPRGQSGIRKKPKRVDYLLRYTRDFSIAVVEGKQEYKHASNGLQQAKEYALDLGLKFAYATNGHAVVEFDFLTGLETELKGFPTPTDLWSRLRAAGKISDTDAHTLLTPYNLTGGKEPYYYQRVAIDRAIECFLKGQRRVLLTMATGTGKTVVAFQICWKLWSSGWRRPPDFSLSPSTRERDGVRCRTPGGTPVGKPRILYLADRTFLVDDPKGGKIPFPIRTWILEFDKIDPEGTAFRYADDGAKTLKFAEYWLDFQHLKFVTGEIFRALDRAVLSSGSRGRAPKAHNEPPPHRSRTKRPPNPSRSTSEAPGRDIRRVGCDAAVDSRQGL